MLAENNEMVTVSRFWNLNRMTMPAAAAISAMYT